ncbi:Rad51-domain-containing protein [Cerioporus squamosus]|nr:Rad51-domain-containing protein [Cerioporus squamosus]
MEGRYLSKLSCLTIDQATMLGKAKLQTVSDLLLKKPVDLAKKCRIPAREMEAIVNMVCKELYQPPTLLRDVANIGEEKFTTGESQMDKTLGGGIRTRLIWEISGENNAGKTQLALQLSLTVQLPPRLGGLSGASCYVTTRQELQTGRLEQMIDCHPLLTPEHCGLANVKTNRVMNFAALERVLTEVVPKLIEDRTAQKLKPIKLLVIDTFSVLFDSNEDSKYEDLVARARDLRKCARLLLQLATKHNLAVVILSSTRDTRPRIDGDDRSPGELRYSDQARWFARALSLPGEDAHEAILGHVWPNQLNVRIMMSRTIRTRPRSEVDPGVRQREDERASKRRRLDAPGSSSTQSLEDERIPYRRFTVIFSSVAPPASCDYVVVEQGVVAFAPEEPPPSTYLYASPTPPPPTSLLSSSSTQPVSEGPPSTPAPDVRYRGAGSTVSSRSGSSWYQQSLSYATVPASPQPTSPPQTGPTTTSTEDAEDEMLWELTQDQGQLLDTLPDDALGPGSEEAAAEEGPTEEHHSSDSELWNHFDSDVD